MELREIFALVLWPVLGILLYVAGRHLSTKNKRIKSSIFFPSFFALSLVFSIFLVIIAPPSGPALPKFLEVEVISVNGIEGNVMAVNANDIEEILIPLFNVTIKVTDRFNKPVSDAMIVLTGAGTAAVGKTGKDGIVVLSIQNARLEENQESAYMKVEVKASGYHKYVEEGIMLVRI